MKSRLLLIALLLRLVAPVEAQPEWQLALPGWRYQYPRDHGPHPGYKTEWWYFTGNVRTAEGRRFGYQLTFFRQGIRPPGSDPATQSRFIVPDFKFAHFAISDPEAKKFRAFGKTSRGAFDEAGFSAAPGPVAWIDDWKLAIGPEERWQIWAKADDVELILETVPAKPWIEHGTDGVSQKADGIGRASHYYSGTRLTTRGTLATSGHTYSVTGITWFDHEWGSNQLTPQQAGWNWFSLHFDDGTELMLYQMRLRDGGIDPNSSGTFVARDATSQHLTRDQYRLIPGKVWRSKESGAEYPISWRIDIPALALSLEVTTPLENQEVQIPPVMYWEGLIDARGTRDGRAISGQGYLEMTGYSGPLVGLSQGTPP